MLELKNLEFVAEKDSDKSAYTLTTKNLQNFKVHGSITADTGKDITSEVYKYGFLNLSKLLNLDRTYTKGIYLVPEILDGTAQYLLDVKWWSIKVSLNIPSSDEVADDEDSISSFYSRVNTETQYDIVISIEEQD